MSNVGGSQAHLNMQPFLALNFCIALQGIFPSPELRRLTMAQPYVGEIRMFAGNFAPAGWMFCEGQLLPISENETLFQLIGTTYGGDGQSTFALPDLRGRIPVHQGNGVHPGRDRRRRGGHADGPARSRPHAPAWLGSTPQGTPPNPSDKPCSRAVRQRRRSTPARRPANHGAAPSVADPSGGSQPHTNLQPYLCVDFIISLFGIFPSPT